MTPEQFRAGIDRLWGYGAQSKAARHWEVAGQTVRRWVSGKTPVPAPVAADLREMLTIAPPPDTTDIEDRDDACAEAIEPRLTEMVSMAEAAGWSRAEITVAVLSLTVSDMLSIAGPAATIETLNQAVSLAQVYTQE